MVHGWYLDCENPEDIDYLLELAREVRPRLKEVALALGSPIGCQQCGTSLDEMVSLYDTIPTEDLTCSVTEIDGKQSLAQVASGGGDCRRMKNALRMAMCSLILYELSRFDRSHAKLKGEITFHHG